MKAFSRILGWIGLVLIFLGAAGYLIAPIFMGFHVIPWALAFLALSVFASYHPAEIRAFLTSRSARYGAGSALSVLLVTGIVVLAAILTLKHSARYDLTENRRFSLAPQTVKVLDHLKAEIRVTAFFQGELGLAGPARDLLDQYAHQTRRFRYQMIDPDRNPDRAKALGITSYSMAVVESGGSSEKIPEITESKLTNAIVRITRPGRKAVYLLTGHGERDPKDAEKTGFSQVEKSLTEQNFEVKSLLLMREKTVPADCAVLIVAGPEKDLLPEETRAISAYLERGGNALFMIEPETVPELVRFLARYHVKIGNDIIVDKMGRLFGGSYLMPLVARYAEHPMTEGFKLTSFFPTARSVSSDQDPAEGASTVDLAFTGEQAWAETDLARLHQGQAAPDPGRDMAGPVPVAVVGALKAGGPEQDRQASKGPPAGKTAGRFVVFGDSDFATNGYYGFQGNGNLFTAAVSWLAGEDDLIAIRPKEDKTQPLMLTANQAKLVLWVPLVLLPLLPLIAGVLVFVRRRARQ